MVWVRVLIQNNVMLFPVIVTLHGLRVGNAGARSRGFDPSLSLGRRSSLLIHVLTIGWIQYDIHIVHYSYITYIAHGPRGVTVHPPPPPGSTMSGIILFRGPH